VGQSFKDLHVWQKSIELTEAVYRLSAKFPTNEQFGLTSQMRRASVSVASNIAEGYGRSTKGEYYQFLGHARGSLSELETQLIIARRLGFAEPRTSDSADSLCADVVRLLAALMRSIRPIRPSSASASP